MNKKVLKALDAACKRLSAMSIKEFKAEMKKHKNGDIALWLIELDNFSKSKYYKKAFENANKLAR